jgi:hypothetical protein
MSICTIFILSLRLVGYRIMENPLVSSVYDSENAEDNGRTKQLYTRVVHVQLVSVFLRHLRAICCTNNGDPSKKNNFHDPRRSQWLCIKKVYPVIATAPSNHSMTNKCIFTDPWTFTTLEEHVSLLLSSHASDSDFVLRDQRGRRHFPFLVLKYFNKLARFYKHKYTVFMISTSWTVWDASFLHLAVIISASTLTTMKEDLLKDWHKLILKHHLRIFLMSPRK